MAEHGPPFLGAKTVGMVDPPRPVPAATDSLSPLENQSAPVMYLDMKRWCLVFLAGGIVAFGGCATDEEFNATQAAKTRETVPGEVNPNAPDASQQTPTKPGFRY